MVAIPQAELGHLQHYRGRRTLDDPLIFEWLPDEEDNPMEVVLVFQPMPSFVSFFFSPPFLSAD